MSTDKCQRIVQRIEKRMAEANLPSVAFAIAQHGRIVHEQALGFADRERHIPATPQTLYPIASITKTLTAMGIMKLVDRGQIDLDQPVNRYLAPEAPVRVWIGKPEDVTVRRIANHAAGLPTYSRFFRSDESIAPIDESISRYANVMVPPAERFIYSNIGYTVLARVIERVSGQSYAQFMEREILRPLGMPHAIIGPPTTPLPQAATVYDWEGNPTTLHAVMTTDHAAASSAMCSVHDLIGLGLFHLQQLQTNQSPVLSAAAITAMQQLHFPIIPGKPADVNIRPDSKYGIGWVIDEDELDVRISHAGGMDGCASKLIILPREQIAIALLSNIFNKALYTFDNDILEEWVPSYVERIAAYRQRLDAMPANEPPAAELAAKLPGQWRGLVHTYEGSMPLTLMFTDTNHGQAQFHDQPQSELRSFLCTGPRVQVQFDGVLPTTDANARVRLPGHSLKLDLFLRRDRLCGALYSLRGNVLNHWVELSRVV